MNFISLGIFRYAMLVYVGLGLLMLDKCGNLIVPIGIASLSWGFGVLMDRLDVIIEKVSNKKEAK